MSLERCLIAEQRNSSKIEKRDRNNLFRTMPMKSIDRFKSACKSQYRDCEDTFQHLQLAETISNRQSPEAARGPQEVQRRELAWQPAIGRACWEIRKAEQVSCADHLDGVSVRHECLSCGQKADCILLFDQQGAPCPARVCSRQIAGLDRRRSFSKDQLSSWLQNVLERFFAIHDFKDLMQSNP